jgi:hypothetical protein
VSHFVLPVAKLNLSVPDEASRVGKMEFTDVNETFLNKFTVWRWTALEDVQRGEFVRGQEGSHHSKSGGSKSMHGIFMALSNPCSRLARPVRTPSPATDGFLETGGANAACITLKPLTDYDVVVLDEAGLLRRFFGSD